ncbi:MAG: type II toxin-antitoxin system VapC family toxin [Bryobacter sp.]|nr:type II toxin-antitoxin system VapC family toxin [Bryobacter sp.]
MAWILDTNILSELRRPKPEQRVLDFVASVPLADMYVSIVTLAEIRYGIGLSLDRVKREALEDWLLHTVRPLFAAERTLAVTEDIILRWRVLMEEGRKMGHTFSQPDLVIAATALHHGLTVLSRDRSQFEKANVPVLRPWET